ncbi:type II toxin-antitoxin system RelE/ParE family toxin [Thiothrix sp.]|jgi:plasmid stabilization system protein ParE|uniref:type II toxin-antitoxin system RelE/ParE family toxin n=1 Tax=Thiothrix sp. TaxID=1032 RepID=UPI002580BAC8|nr:type II toxin-antitoxin system RelE/ParE family toxin [Thiothrix sp.]
MRIELHPDAEADLVDGFAFYDAQQAGLGDYFVDSLLADLESLQIYAGIHPIHFGFNRLLAKRFPFAVYYRVENEVVRVYAVLDCRRDPVVTHERLG